MRRYLSAVMLSIALAAQTGLYGEPDAVKQPDRMFVMEDHEALGVVDVREYTPEEEDYWRHTEVADMYWTLNLIYREIVGAIKVVMEEIIAIEKKQYSTENPVDAVQFRKNELEMAYGYFYIKPVEKIARLLYPEKEELFDRLNVLREEIDKHADDIDVMIRKPYVNDVVVVEIFNDKK